ncbi:hypothetical protein MTR_7g074810 [Medicago truncatula]|uniref:Uncharacterized protein n=1 Tax=Medicago truncatula TaxID=3880 RepID=G7KZB5_MEDTR|nr:hypothetical protein MTR_7g074810 [Medicago truncatula]
MTLELPQLINIACLVQMLNLTLEIYTLIYHDAYLGCSLEGLGNIMMHAMVEIPVSPPLEQMLQDYDEWVQNQLYCLNQSSS